MKKESKKIKQFDVLDEGSVVLITPLTKKAQRWMRENVESESWQWLGGGLGVDSRYADQLISAMSEALN
jgi:hypothetical protein